MERQIAAMKKKSLLGYLREFFGAKKKERPSAIQLNTEETELLKYRLKELMNQKAAKTKEVITQMKEARYQKKKREGKTGGPDEAGDGESEEEGEKG